MPGRSPENQFLLLFKNLPVNINIARDERVVRTWPGNMTTIGKFCSQLENICSNNPTPYDYFVYNIP